MKRKEVKNPKKAEKPQIPSNPKFSQIRIQKKMSLKERILELNTEFDESIYFNHHYTAFQKLAVEKPISQTTIPFLMIREFLFSYFEEKAIIKEADKESITQILGHIKQYSNSHELSFILNFLENIKTYAEMIGIKNTSNSLVPALAKVVDDPYSAKIQFLKSLLPFIDYLVSIGDEGIKILKNNIMNIIQELYHQKNNQNINEEMKKLLFQNFIKISRAILPYDKELYILNIIIGFGNEDNFRNNLKTNINNQKVIEHKILSIKYVRKLVEGFGKANTERYLLPQLMSFAVEKNEDIKKEVLFTIPIISEIISFEFISTKIYDILRRISNEPNADLRRICVKVIAKILKTFKNKCEQDKKNNKENNNKNYSAQNFINIIEKLCKDKENSVKFTIIEKIGEIISPLEKEELSKDLLDFYKKFVLKYYEEKKNQLPLGATVQNSNNSLSKQNSKGSSQNTSGKNLFQISMQENKDDYDEIRNMNNEFNKQITEEELNYYFAYNFPAILYCYGKQEWPELKNIYFDFCFDDNIKIRLSIIASFPEIVNILGKEITENELIPVYDKFLESNERYEHKLAIKNLPKILLKVNKNLKERYFKYFEPVSIFMDTSGKKVRNFNFIEWKNKLNVIEGILCYYNLYDNDIIYNSILPQCITFCMDKFYKVRKTSSVVLANLIAYLYKENYKKEKIVKILENFAFHKKFQIRINFIKMCPILLGEENLYKVKVQQLIEIIANKDKILDVKIALAKVLKKIIINEKSPLKDDEFIHKICNILCKNDFIKGIFKDIKIKNINVDENSNISDDKKYFKENNTFFIEEFNIECDRKDNKLLSCDIKPKSCIFEDNKTKNKNEEIDKNKNDKKEVKEEIKSDKKEENVDKNKDTNEIKEKTKKEEKKETKVETKEEIMEEKMEEKKIEDKKEEIKVETKEEIMEEKMEEKEETKEYKKEETKQETKVETKKETKEEAKEETKEEAKQEEEKQEEKQEKKQEEKQEEKQGEKVENKKETKEETKDSKEEEKEKVETLKEEIKKEEENCKNDNNIGIEKEEKEEKEENKNIKDEIKENEKTKENENKEENKEKKEETSEDKIDKKENEELKGGEKNGNNDKEEEANKNEEKDKEEGENNKIEEQEEEKK